MGFIKKTVTLTSAALDLHDGCSTETYFDNNVK